MKKKILIALLAVLVVCAMTFALTACATDKEYTLSYALGAHAAADATAPTGGDYKKGADVTLADALDAADDWEFDGWSDGTTKYAAGATYKMPAKDVVMTAQWKEVGSGSGDGCDHVLTTATRVAGTVTHTGVCTECNETVTVDCEVELNVCEICDHTYTVAEIVEAMEELDNQEYLPGTYQLEGTVTNIRYAWSEANGISFDMKVGDYSFYVYKLMEGTGADTILKGATVKLNGELQVYGDDNEIKDAELIELTNPSFAVTFNVDEHGHLQNEQGQDATLDDTYAGNTVLKFKVRVDQGWEVASVKANNKPINATNGVYSVTITEATTIVITTQEEYTGQMYDKTATFVAADQGYDAEQKLSGESVTVKDVTFSFDNGGNTTNGPAYFAPAIRFYARNTITVSVPTTMTITKITLGFATGNGNLTITADTGTYEDGEWTGSASSITFTMENRTGSNIRVATIDVDYSSPEGVQSYPVTINCGSEGSYTTVPANLTGDIEEDTEITLNVTANQGWQIDKVTLNGRELEAEGAGVYKFIVTSQNTVVITFKEALQEIGEVKKATIDFTEKFDEYAANDWGSYSDKTLTNSDLGVSGLVFSIIMNANKQTNQAITTMPVTKTKAITVSVTDASIKKIKFTFAQWGDKALGTLKLKVTYAGGTAELTGNTNFEQEFDLSAYTLVTKVELSSSNESNQAGIQGMEISYKDVA